MLWRALRRREIWSSLGKRERESDEEEEEDEEDE